MTKSTQISRKSRKLMTFTEVQAYLGVKSRKTLLKYIMSGELAAFKLGGTRWRLLRADVDQFLKKEQWQSLVAVQ
ncbi:MAG: helix-turn-helix domain-containing protein [Candidatus Omnitrophota bacterium]|nr:helix-turn-helix domain-containing protein [Candidatus Omnitrophota bacterium]